MKNAVKPSARSAKLQTLKWQVARLQVQQIGLLVDELAAKVARDVQQLGLDGKAFLGKVRSELSAQS